jgi:2-haloacid dehalogenase
LIEAYAARFEETLPRSIPGTHALVERLSAAGVPLYALTNFGAEFWARFRAAQPIFERFADVIVSGEERCAKPDARIYEIAERRIGLPPRTLFFIDDNPDNVAAAAARGWQAHLFRDAATLEADLIERGVLA